VARKPGRTAAPSAADTATNTTPAPVRSAPAPPTPRRHRPGTRWVAIDGDERKRVGYRLADIDAAIAELTAPGALTGQAA